MTIRKRIAAASILGLASLASADEIIADAADAAILTSPLSGFIGIFADNLALEVGVNGGIMRTAVYPFELPPRPEGFVVSAASLEVFTLRNHSAPEMTIDLYALPARLSPTVVMEDEYFGPFDDDPNVTLLQEDFINVANTDINNVVPVTNAAEVEADLVEYLNSAYDSVGEGGFAILRLNSSNAAPPNLHFYFVYASEHFFPPNPATDRRPRLTIEFAKGASCPADFNGDGVVDGADLATLLSNWGQSGAADLTGDDVVDGADLASLLSTWGACAG